MEWLCSLKKSNCEKGFEVGEPNSTDLRPDYNEEEETAQLLEMKQFIHDQYPVCRATKGQAWTKDRHRTAAVSIEARHIVRENT